MRSVPREMGMPRYCDDPESIGDSAQHGLLGIALCDSCTGLRIGSSGNWRVVMEPSCGSTMAAIESLSLSSRRKISIVAMLVELLLWCWHRPFVVGQSPVLSALDLWSSFPAIGDQVWCGWWWAGWGWVRSKTLRVIHKMNGGWGDYGWYWRCPRESSSRKSPAARWVKPVVNFIQSVCQSQTVEEIWSEKWAKWAAGAGGGQRRNGGKAAVIRWLSPVHPLVCPGWHRPGEGAMWHPSKMISRKC